MLRQIAAVFLLLSAIVWSGLVGLVAYEEAFDSWESYLFLAGVLLPCVSAIYLVISQKLYRKNRA